MSLRIYSVCDCRYTRVLSMESEGNARPPPASRPSMSRGSSSTPSSVSTEHVPYESLETRGSTAGPPERERPQAPLTGNKDADEDIRAFYRARDDLLRQRGMALGKAGESGEVREEGKGPASPLSSSWTRK